LVYRFESSRRGYLTAIHVDTHGAATLLYPRSDVEAGMVHSGQAIRLPSVSDGFRLAVQPPIGRDLVYAIVTDKPITRADLGIESTDIVVSFEPHQAPALARQLSQVLDSRASGEVRIAQVAQQVDGRGSVQYRSADIVGFFGERTRSIRPAKLDLQIQFQTNSSDLDDAARRNIDEFARALEDPKLRDMRFKVAGHTDARGSEQHNMGLSDRRAITVRDYLIEVGGIDADRLEAEAMGETHPLMRDESEYARQMNRRVEFTPLR
jgi:outer membrane protein OmpA-like peptidoglycan-associated protein